MPGKKVFVALHHVFGAALGIAGAPNHDMMAFDNYSLEHTMLDAGSHELPLQTKPDSALWSENFALAVSSPANGISLLHSIGTWYGDTTVWREKLSIELPGGAILMGRNYGRNTRGSTGANVVSASLSRYEILEHEKSVRLTWDGPVWNHSFHDLMTRGFYGGLAKLLKLDLRFEAFAPIWNMKKDGAEDATGITGAMHTEQMGWCRGSLAYDGKTYAIEQALSCRDHSRGKRDFAPYKNHCWINGNFPGAGPGGRSFQLYVANIEGMDGPALSTAVINDGQTQYPATVIHVDYLQHANDIKAPQTIVLDSALGEMTIRSTKSLTTLPVSVVEPFEAQPGIIADRDHGIIFDETIELDWNGQTGLGWSERGIMKRLG